MKTCGCVYVLEYGVVLAEMIASQETPVQYRQVKQMGNMNCPNFTKWGVGGSYGLGCVITL